MSDEKMKTTAKIIIGGEEITIHKLKAGKFYDAQKIVAEMFREAAKIEGASPVEKGKTPDIKDVDIGGLTGLFEKLPQQIARFIAVCSKMEIKDLLEKAYPEEINKAFAVCLELNNVMENLKNSIAPIGKLGVSGKV